MSFLMNIFQQLHRVVRYELFVTILIVLPPLWVSIFIIPVLWWFIFSLFYAISFVAIAKFNRSLGRAVLLLLSLLPFVFFNILLFVNYHFQESGFNEAFYYHFNSRGIYGHEQKVILLGVVGLVYFLLMSFCTYRFKPLQGRLKFLVIGTGFVVLVSLVSPQVLSFAGMYLDAHSDNLLSRHLRSINVTEDPVTNDIISGANADFAYSVREKKNLVFIYAESLERNFSNQDLFPGELVYLDAKKSSVIDFSNMIQTSYTGWTIAGMVASLCGYPLQIPLDSSSHNYNLYDKFMPNAECMSDLLKKEDYYLTFMGGADLNFAGKRAFLNTHSFEDIRGKQSYLKKYPENEIDYNLWGLRDRPLLDEAYKEFMDLSSNEKPFGMFVLTLDTHAPGFPDPVCSERYEYIKDNKMLDAVHCSTHIIRDFVKKIRESNYSEQTVIVIMSDHLAHGNPANKYLKHLERKLMFMIDLPSGSFADVTNAGTHYDVAPTVLAAIGFESQQAYGFGQSMLNFYSGEKHFAARNGLLPDRIGHDDIEGFAKKNVVKSYIRGKWGDYLGAIGEEGLRIDELKYSIGFGGKEYSFRHPNPGKLSQAGVLLFRLGRDAYQVKDIFSFNDYVELPDNFSIKHWLKGKKGFYLYVGSRRGVPFLHMKNSSSNNILAFIDLQKGTETVIPLQGNLTLSLKAINDLISSSDEQDRGGQIKPDSSLFGDEMTGISVLSCLDEVCQSHIEDVQHESHLAQWGMSVWQLADTGKVELLEHIDHCGDRSAFDRSMGLNALVHSAKQAQQSALILIGHNSVFCEPKGDLLRWLGSFDFAMLRNIKFKQPYIAILNLKTDEIEEFTGKEMVQVTF